ncbi:F-box/kelch-repeat protein At3g06240-like [Cynara cardunculus var. scolymus]|uniref:F-box/kelch-repeat protein At3g06240-like n=1 Tax=Cynara cardunculus var. scolymus TaxID=59895 RepID=UPI000D624D84|nr:F-box/kelch-repeat protein At3g06240-like [Cynara cardunculus var. scolymus]XP_024986213.1 F-box/kelch-repeat protein At3g06240-like [Cynara cardunculus var. scolymus]
MGELLPEILEQILVRLDVRDIIRCKSVCKAWESFISDPDFVKAHLKHSYNNDRNDNEIGERRIVMARYPYRYRVRQYEVDDRFFDYHYCHLIGSSNGLVCISILNTEILLANPSIREVKKLQRPQIPHVGSLCWGFGYDSSVDDYKVILGFRKGDDLTCFHVLTLKSNEWKVIGEVNYTFVSRIGILCNGALHWIMKGGSPQDDRKVILSFHISKEEFIEIPQPDDARFESLIAGHLALRLGTIDECLCIFLRSLLPHNIWIMKKYNVKQSWEMVDHDCEIKNEAAHCMKELKHYIPHKRPLCHKTWFCKTRDFIGAPIFVQSLVSPHVNRRPKRKRLVMTSTRSRRRFGGDPSVPGPVARV